MANPFYVFNTPVVTGTTIRADKYNSDQQAIETAFDAADEKFNRSVLLPNTFSGNPAIPEVTVNNSFIYIDTDGDIDLYPIATFLQQFADVDTKHQQIDQWQQQVGTDKTEASSSAILAGKYAENPEDIYVQGTDYSAKHYAAKAAASAVDAAAEVSLAEGEVSKAANHVTAAENARDLAAEYADKGENIPVTGTSRYSALHYSLKAKYWSDNAAATVGNNLDDYVPKTTTVNGKALTTNITLLPADITGLGTVVSEDITTGATDVTADRVTKVGDFGWGIAISGFLADTENMAFTGTAQVSDAGGTLNVPSGTIGHILNLSNNMASTSQVLLDRVAQELKYRTSAGGAFTGWKTVWDSSNLVKTTNATDTTTGRIPTTTTAAFKNGASGTLGGQLSVDTLAGATGFYTGFGGLHANANAGDNPFPNKSGAFTLFHHKGLSDNNNEYTAQIATNLNVSQRTIRYRTIAESGAGWSPWADLWDSNNLPVTVGGSGNVQVTNNLIVGTTNAGDILQVSAQNNAGEGGQIHLENSSGDAVTSGNLVVDLLNGKFRVFEGAGTNRGALLDLTKCEAGIATEFYTTSNPNTNTLYAVSSLTLNRDAPKTELDIRTAAGARIVTLAASGWVAGDSVTIHKSVLANTLTINTTQNVFDKNNTSIGTAQTIPDGTSMTITLTYSTNNEWSLSVQG